ncbi:MAG: ubiquinol-cytochrome c reductase iron-sulfur subunit [Nitrospirota bacterium]
MKRRSFLSLSLAILGSTALATLVYPLVRFLAPPEAKTLADKLSIKKDDILPGEAKKIQFGNTPAIVINIYGKGYIALSQVCTHLGCLVEYDKEKKQLVCPCHAGVFNLEGHVVSGPPPKPLPTLPLKVEGEHIIIG